MSDRAKEQTDRPNGGSKVGRAIETFELDGVGVELEARWLGRGGERASLRELATWFNQQLLERVMAAADLQPLDGEVENTYRLLTSDDVSSGVRTHAENRLRREGVDLDRLRENFVTHQAIHTYLTKYRNVEFTDKTGRAGTDRLETVERLRSRLSTVTEGEVSSAKNADEIAIGDPNVFVSVRVYCEECNQQYLVGEFFERGGCDCDR